MDPIVIDGGIGPQAIATAIARRDDRTATNTSATARRGRRRVLEFDG